MAKKKTNKSSDYVGFRAKTEEQKLQFYNRAEILKGNGYSKADIFEAGLLALEQGASEEQIQRKKAKEINERDSYLEKAIQLNKHIEALNRRLKNKPNGRHTNLAVEDQVLTIEILDNEGNKYEF